MTYYWLLSSNNFIHYFIIIYLVLEFHLELWTYLHKSHFEMYKSKIISYIDRM